MKKIRFLAMALILMISCISTIFGMEQEPVRLTEIALEQRGEAKDLTHTNVLENIECTENNNESPVEFDLQGRTPDECNDIQFKVCMNFIEKNDSDKIQDSLKMLGMLHARYLDSLTVKDWINQRDNKTDIIIDIDALNQKCVTNYVGDTLLHRAACFNRSNIVEILINNGANINVKNKHGITPLFYAVKKNSLDVAKILLEAKADQKIKAIEIVHHVAAVHGSSGGRSRGRSRKGNTYKTAAYTSTHECTVENLYKQPQMQRIFDLAKDGKEIVIPKESEFHSFIGESLICCPCIVSIAIPAVIIHLLTCGIFSDCLKNNACCENVKKLDQRAWEIRKESGCCCITATHTNYE